MNEQQKEAFEKLPQTQQDALNLCWEIEKLPASERQTKVSMMAAELSRSIENMLKTEITKTTEEMLEIVNSLVKARNLNQAAQRIGIAPSTLLVMLKQGRVSEQVAKFFGYEKKTIYVKKV